MGCEGLIGSYVHIYYTCQGSRTLASYITGIGGTLTILSTFAALPFGCGFPLTPANGTARWPAY